MSEFTEDLLSSLDLQLLETDVKTMLDGGKQLKEVLNEILFVRFLAGCIDDEQESVAEVADHQIVENSAILICKESIALPARS